MIALIGGSGFVGTRLASILTDFDFKNFDKAQSYFFPEKTIISDVRNQSDLDKELKDQETVVLLAAENRDDVSPVSLYYDVNVQGAKNVLEAMDKNGVKNILFMSTVAIYGLNKKNPDENHPADPFNHYGKSKWETEGVLREWYNKDPKNRSLTILRPTVIFGERNRGNVFNLLKEIASGRFLMVGNGRNFKSMAYVGNVVALIKHCMVTNKLGSYQLFNYVDKPDMNMNDLVKQVEVSLGKKLPPVHFPYWMGYCGGLCFDFVSLITGKKLTISSVRVKNFCATTQFDATAVHKSGYVPPFTLSEGLHNTLKYEFLDKEKDGIEFISE